MALNCQETIPSGFLQQPSRHDLHNACLVNIALGNMPYEYSTWDTFRHALSRTGLVEAHKACFPGNTVLRRQLDDWTEDFEAEEARKRREAAAAQEEQGWTVVKRRGVGSNILWNIKLRSMPMHTHMHEGPRTVTVLFTKQCSCSLQEQSIALSLGLSASWLNGQQGISAKWHAVQGGRKSSDGQGAAVGGVALAAAQAIAASKKVNALYTTLRASIAHGKPRGPRSP